MWAQKVDTVSAHHRGLLSPHTFFLNAMSTYMLELKMAHTISDDNRTQYNCIKDSILASEAYRRRVLGEWLCELGRSPRLLAQARHDLGLSGSQAAYRRQIAFTRCPTSTTIALRATPSKNMRSKWTKREVERYGRALMRALYTVHNN